MQSAMCSAHSRPARISRAVGEVGSLSVSRRVLRSFWTVELVLACLGATEQGSPTSALLAVVSVRSARRLPVSGDLGYMRYCGHVAGVWLGEEIEL